MEKWAGSFHLGHGPPILGAIRERAVAILDLTRMATSTLPVKVVEVRSAARAADLFDQYFSRLTSGPPARWNLTTAGGLLALIIIWAASLYVTWATWGSLTVDSGREMYVATVLSEGKTLYRDVWFLNGPAAPYLNSFLFRLFGVHLNVLYWAGALSALGSAIFLYLTGMRLSSWLAGFSAGAVLLLEAFHPTIFCFPLPYSYCAVYGCLTACLFLWLAVEAASSRGWGWMFGAGMAAAAALLLKLEFGAACYFTLGLLIVARGVQKRSWRSIPRDVIAILPGVLICALVIRWMISIAGVSFILDENFMTWPSSYFMKVYGKYWLDRTGFSLSLRAFAEAAKETLVFLGCWQGLHLILTWKGTDRRSIRLRAVLFLATVAYLVIFFPASDMLRAIFFPKDMVLYVTVAAMAALLYFWRQPKLQRASGFIFLLIFSSLLAFRILLRMTPGEYAIYYNGPVVLSFLLLLRPLIPQSGSAHRIVFPAEWLLCLGCVAVPALYARKVVTQTADWVPLTTERGTIVIKKSLAEQYRAGIRFMKEKNDRGEAVLSVPEDASLYFLSGTHCPTRILQFTPGSLVPGKMTEETIREIEEKPVRYLVWSNRLFPEYGVLRFGTDFDQTMGGYLTSHYRRTVALSPNYVKLGDWNAYIWERIPESESPSPASKAMIPIPIPNSTTLGQPAVR
jgi:hypothetical protein